MNEAKRLSEAERSLLIWLSAGDGQYGECHGRSLDALIESGLVVVGGEDSGFNNGFIAKGAGIMYRSVTITPAGRLALNPPTESHLAGKETGR